MYSTIIFVILMWGLTLQYGDFANIPMNKVLLAIFVGFCALVQYSVESIVKAIKER